jgi:hypothetical protein
MNIWRPQKVVPFWSLAGAGGLKWMQWTQYKSRWIHQLFAKYETNTLIRPLKKSATSNRIHMLPLWTVAVGNNPNKKEACICQVWNAWFNITFVYARCSAQCYTAHNVTQVFSILLHVLYVHPHLNPLCSLSGHWPGLMDNGDYRARCFPLPVYCCNPAPALSGVSTN